MIRRRLGKNRKSCGVLRYDWRSFLALSLSILVTPVTQANVVGSDAQNFNPTTSGLDFVTVHSSETLEPGIFNFGVFINQAVNTLPYYDETDSQGRQTRVNPNDTVLGADVNMGVGLAKDWDIGISLPQVLNQSVEAGGQHLQFGQTGSTEVRLNSKYRLWGTSSYGVAVIGTASFNRIENNPYVGSGGGPTYTGELVADTTIKEIALAANVGYRWRKPGEKLPDFPLEPFHNQMIGSLAASYLLSSLDTKVIAEVFGNRPAEAVSYDINRQQSSAEALIGLKHDLSNSVAVHSGFGTELTNGVSSPDWRIYAGINWSVGPVFKRPEHPIKTTAATSGVTTFAQQTTDPFAGEISKDMERVVVHDILFEFDSDHLVKGEADKTLAKLVEYLNRAPKFTKMVIEGHSCSIGSKQYNLDLSRRRAQTIRRWLIDKFKLDGRKLEAVGYGPMHPLGDNGNFQGRQMNRRVEFKIYRQ